MNRADEQCELLHSGETSESPNQSNAARDESAAPANTFDRADRIRRLEQMFADWAEEDGKLTEEEADLLGDALKQSSRLQLQSPDVC